MLPGYYKLRDWNLNTGLPSKLRLQKLDMNEIAAASGAK